MYISNNNSRDKVNILSYPHHLYLFTGVAISFFRLPEVFNILLVLALIMSGIIYLKSFKSENNFLLEISSIGLMILGVMILLWTNPKPQKDLLLFSPLVLGYILKTGLFFNKKFKDSWANDKVKVIIEVVFISLAIIAMLKANQFI